MGRDGQTDRLASLMMGLWRSMARSPRSRTVDDEDEGLVLFSMLEHMAVEAWEAHKMSIRFMLDRMAMTRRIDGTWIGA